MPFTGGVTPACTNRVLKTTIIPGEQSLRIQYPIVFKKTVPGWTEHVEQYKQVALYWHRCWKDEGLPHQGETSRMHRVTRSQYHRVANMVKRDSIKISMNKMAEAMACDFFTESRKLKGQNNNLYKTIDNASNDADIANLFCKKYNELYNSVSYNNSDMENLSEC